MISHIIDIVSCSTIIYMTHYYIVRPTITSLNNTKYAAFVARLLFYTVSEDFQLSNKKLG
jgi:hypothetical protein